MQFPIKLLPLASFEFKHLEAVDDAEDVNNAYEESGTTGTLWTPPEGANKQPNMVPQMIALPTVGFKILQGLGGWVIPNKLHAAITDYINFDTAELGNDNSWVLVLDWLLCMAQAKANRASILALSVDAVCTADNDKFQ